VVKYIRFGSEDSLDVDLMIVLPKLGKNNEENKKIIAKYERRFNCPVNLNLCVVERGFVVDAYKGTVDEVNNSIFHTFKNFDDQYYDNNPIKGIVKRDVELKLLRGLRIILSFLSRSQYRIAVKAALKGDVYAKIAVLKEIDLTTISKVDFNEKNATYIDTVKTISFQLAQMQCLLFDIEIYSKTTAKHYYNKLTPYIDRQESDLTELEKAKNILLWKLERVSKYI
jgi:hypothetical protein